MKYITIAILLTLVAFLLSEAAHAQECSTPTEIAQILADYSEIPVFAADSDGKALMGFVNYTTGTYSIVLRLNRGSYCLVFFGDQWQDI